MTGPLDFCSYSSSGSAVETDRDSFGNPKYGQSVSLRLEISSSKLANASRIVMTGSVLASYMQPLGPKQSQQVFWGCRTKVG